MSEPPTLLVARTKPPCPSTASPHPSPPPRTQYCLPWANYERKTRKTESRVMKMCNIEKREKHTPKLKERRWSKNTRPRKTQHDICTKNDPFSHANPHATDVFWRSESDTRTTLRKAKHGGTDDFWDPKVKQNRIMRHPKMTTLRR